MRILLDESLPRPLARLLPEHEVRTVAAMGWTRKRSELLTHIQNTNSQYCLPPFGKKIAYKTNRHGLPDRFRHAPY